jgi:hypothetical protein
MTSTRVPPRRIQTQILRPTPAKPTISVEEWEAKAPLLDSAAKSINAIKAASENRPLPPKVRSGLVHHGRVVYQPSAKFLPDDVLSSRPSTPTIRKLGGPSSRPGTPNISTPTTARGNAALHALKPKTTDPNPQQFYDWFTLIDQSVAEVKNPTFTLTWRRSPTMSRCAIAFWSGSNCWIGKLRICWKVGEESRKVGRA